jgi:hypothetical protein
MYVVLDGPFFPNTLYLKRNGMKNTSILFCLSVSSLNAICPSGNNNMWIKISMEYFRSILTGEYRKYSETSLYQNHIFHHKFYKKCPPIKQKSPQ